MNILILGGDGMLGYELVKRLGAGHDVTATLRLPLAAYGALEALRGRRAIGEVDARDWPRLSAVVRDVRPDAVVNCIGIVKQRPDAKSAIPSLEINSLLPHRLNELCGSLSARLVHFSTDCVFSGRQGRYTEQDETDALDLYGRTKLLGEVSDAPGLTIRSSIIGLEHRAQRTGLIEWFLAQRGPIRGFRRAIYTGLTTAAMGRLVAWLLESHPSLTGLWHVASAPVNKYDLLVQLAKTLGRHDVTITPDDDFFCDRSLLADPFNQTTGYRAPSWEAMLDELAQAIRARDGA